MDVIEQLSWLGYPLQVLHIIKISFDEQHYFTLCSNGRLFWVDLSDLELLCSEDRIVIFNLLPCSGDGFIAFKIYIQDIKAFAANVIQISESQ